MSTNNNYYNGYNGNHTNNNGNNNHNGNTGYSEQPSQYFAGNGYVTPNNSSSANAGSFPPVTTSNSNSLSNEPSQPQLPNPSIQLLTTLDAKVIAQVLELKGTYEETLKSIAAKQQEISKWEEEGVKLRNQLDLLTEQLAKHYSRLNALLSGETPVVAAANTQQQQQQSSVGPQHQAPNGSQPQQPNDVVEEAQAILDEAYNSVSKPWLENL